MHQVLALDQSHNSTGVCRATHYDGSRSLFCTNLITPGLGMCDATLAHYFAWLRECLASDHYDLVVMENYAFGKFNSADSAALGTVLRLACHIANVPYLLVTPMQVKKWAIGPDVKSDHIPTKVRKDKVKFAAYKTFGEQITCDDEADAAWMADIGLHIVANIEPQLVYRQEVLKALRESKVNKSAPPQTDPIRSVPIRSVSTASKKEQKTMREVAA